MFVRSSSGGWAQHAKLTASDDSPGDGSFGGAVAISGETIIVGMYFCDSCSNLNPGLAYVFARSGSHWIQAQKISPSDGARNDFFGCSVSISGSTMAVGALNADIGSNAEQGSAYVFTAVWSQKQKLTAIDGTAAAHFGNAVSISGSTLVAGAAADNSGRGSAYVFVGSSFGTQQTKLTAGDGAPLDSFGNAVAVFNDTIVVGAPGDNHGANADQGSVYVFARSGGVWTQQAKLTASDGAAGDYFGRAVAVYEDRIVVGAPGDDVGSNANQARLMSSRAAAAPGLRQASSLPKARRKTHSATRWRSAARRSSPARLALTAVAARPTCLSEAATPGYKCRS